MYVVNILCMCVKKKHALLLKLAAYYLYTPQSHSFGGVFHRLWSQCMSSPHL